MKLTVALTAAAGLWFCGLTAAQAGPPRALSFSVSAVAPLGRPTSGYVTGDKVALSCPGVDFATLPSVSVTASGGVVTGLSLVDGGSTGDNPPTNLTCSQASTTGVGVGLMVSTQFGSPLAGVGAPGGASQAIQFNSGGTTFGGVAPFTYNPATGALTFTWNTTSGANPLNLLTSAISVSDPTAEARAIQFFTTAHLTTGDAAAATQGLTSQLTLDNGIYNSPVSGHQASIYGNAIYTNSRAWSLGCTVGVDCPGAAGALQGFDAQCGMNTGGEIVNCADYFAHSPTTHAGGVIDNFWISYFDGCNSGWDASFCYGAVSGSTFNYNGGGTWTPIAMYNARGGDNASITASAVIYPGYAVSTTIAAAGSGYNNNDRVQVVGGTCSTNPWFLLTVSGGVVTAVTPYALQGGGIPGGNCSTTPSNPVSTTGVAGQPGGTGSGLTLNITWGSLLCLTTRPTSPLLPNAAVTVPGGTNTNIWSTAPADIPNARSCYKTTGPVQTIAEESMTFGNSFTGFLSDNFSANVNSSEAGYYFHLGAGAIPSTDAGLVERFDNVNPTVPLSNYIAVKMGGDDVAYFYSNDNQGVGNQRVDGFAVGYGGGGPVAGALPNAVPYHYNLTAKASINTDGAYYAGGTVGVTCSGGKLAETKAGITTGCDNPAQGISGYTNGAATWWGNALAGTTQATSTTGAANSVYCSPYFVTNPVTFKAMGIRVVATSTGNGSLALAGAIYSNFVNNGTNRPGTLIDFTTTPFATGSAASVSSALNNGSDAFTQSQMIWTCVMKFDTTATFSAFVTTADNVSAYIGSVTLANAIGVNPVVGVSTAATTFNVWPNFNNSTVWAEQGSTAGAPIVALQSQSSP